MTKLTFDEFLHSLHSDALILYRRCEKFRKEIRKLYEKHHDPKKMSENQR